MGEENGAAPGTRMQGSMSIFGKAEAGATTSWGIRSLASLLSTALVLLPFTTGKAHAKASEPAQIWPDTIARRPAPRFLQQRLLFTPEYLNRLREISRRHETSAVEIEIMPPTHGDALLFAERYGIEPALALMIFESAVQEGIDPELAFRLVRVESVFQPNARGPGGALGLVQLMPSTARSIDRSLRTEAQILEPKTNLRTGFRYLRTLIERYQGDVRLGVLAYNRGERAVDRAIRGGRDPENGYSAKVLGGSGNRYTGIGVMGTAP